ncbi:MAG TPA: hypothetical protein VEH06_10575 [Candidatus Bathyarchaeia archaeon]|nr:hypothetical protein [Candidatus Bathyarchaeia archaeon]
MLRIPGSFNSKLAALNEKGEIVNIPESAEVKIMQEWNGVRPSIKPLLPEFYIYLADSKLKEIHRNRKPRKYSVHYETSHKIRYIETLLQIPSSIFDCCVVISSSCSSSMSSIFNRFDLHMQIHVTDKGTYYKGIHYRYSLIWPLWDSYL